MTFSYHNKMETRDFIAEVDEVEQENEATGVTACADGVLKRLGCSRRAFGKTATAKAPFLIQFLIFPGIFFAQWYLCYNRV